MKLIKVILNIWMVITLTIIAFIIGCLISGELVLGETVSLIAILFQILKLILLLKIEKEKNEKKQKKSLITIILISIIIFFIPINKVEILDSPQAQYNGAPVETVMILRGYYYTNMYGIPIKTEIKD